jgi:hypothetical protein
VEITPAGYGKLRRRRSVENAINVTRGAPKQIRQVQAKGYQSAVSGEVVVLANGRHAVLGRKLNNAGPVHHKKDIRWNDSTDPCKPLLASAKRTFTDLSIFR